MVGDSFLLAASPCPAAVFPLFFASPSTPSSHDGTSFSSYFRATSGKYYFCPFGANPCFSSARISTNSALCSGSEAQLP